METRHYTVYLLLLFTIVSSGAEADKPMPAIRSFDIKTIESLGRKIYEQDAYAARATDILFERIGGSERLRKEGIVGWVVSEQGAKVVVRFIKAEKDSFIPVYDVTFSTMQQGDLASARGKHLSTTESAQFKARELALKNIPGFCSEKYNFVVLPNIGANGFLVYALAATMDPNLVIIGGHYRFTISSDGRRIEQTDRLSKSCLTLDKRDGASGSALAALSATHIVSDTPVETHVFLNLLNKLPLFIGTMDGKVWKIENGSISIIGK